MNYNNKIRFFEFFFVKFPIFFPIVYLFFLTKYPAYEAYIIFFTLLILAEPHFGATWPFLLYKKNTEIVLNNKFYYIGVPILIIFFSIISFYFSQKLFYFVFLVANMFHVTRQSVGVSKLYVKKNFDEKNFQEILIYIFAIIFFFIGLLRFYTPILDNNYIVIPLVILAMVIPFLWYVYLYKLSSNALILLTGILIFFPMCFVDKPVHAITMGVTMHYTQYLYLTYKVYKKRIVGDTVEKKTPNPINYFLFIIILYGAIMSGLSITSKTLNIENLILIPITGQFIHFYLDSLLWKFRNPHHREVTLKYLV